MFEHLDNNTERQDYEQEMVEWLGEPRNLALFDDGEKMPPWSCSHY